MRVWTSGELQSDVDDPFRFARKDVERELSNSVATQDYGTGVIEWALIYILLPKSDSFLQEIRRYKSAIEKWNFGCRWIIKPSRKVTYSYNGKFSRQHSYDPSTCRGSWELLTSMLSVSREMSLKH